MGRRKKSMDPVDRRNKRVLCIYELKLTIYSLECLPTIENELKQKTIGDGESYMTN
jgi:hypothetical protein